jgi:hypothetical protein
LPQWLRVWSTKDKLKYMVRRNENDSFLRHSWIISFELRRGDLVNWLGLMMSICKEAQVMIVKSYVESDVRIQVIDDYRERSRDC